MHEMKKYYSFACFVLFTLSATTLSAQLAMTRSTFASAYSAINMPSASLSTASGDDAAQSAIPIGFTFNYLGTNYTSIGVNTNGVASFSTTMVTSATNSNLYNTTNPQLSIAPWWDNLITDTILYITQGVSPNQVFIIQWTNAMSYNAASTQMLNFQVILYETTNVIEFSYGNVVTGTTNANESASIGIEGVTGGNGNYLDAVTGSAFTSNGMLNSTTKWPDHNFRFTPGAPTPVAGGTYTVGAGGNYFNLSEAVADLNHRGISGQVTFSLTDANYDATAANGHNIFPILLGPVAGVSTTDTIVIQSAAGTSTLSYEGALNGNCGNAAATNIITNANEPVFGLIGASYVTVLDINFTCSSTGEADRGIACLNSSATAGSQHNTFRGISVNLNRTNSPYGIEQRAVTTPTSAAGANSDNHYYDLSIGNVAYGIYLNGNANFPDTASIIGTTSNAVWNSIGGAVADDISSAAVSAYGIRAANQSGAFIYNNEVRNVTQGANNNGNGIFLEAAQGNCEIHHNKIHDIKCSAPNGTGIIAGIRANVANTGTASIRIYNNFIGNITSEFTGAATATRTVYGIYVQAAGGGTGTSAIYVSFNNVRIDNSAYPNISTTCFETGTTTGPVISLRNNVLANFTGTQAGAANHLCIATPTTAAIGNTGSVSDNNDLFIANTANGFIGRGNTTNYATLANWQAAMTQDANSISVNPVFNSLTDLHVGAAGLDGAADISGLPWVTNDVDFQSRTATPDIGADEFTPLLIDAGVTTLISPYNTGCHLVNEYVITRIKNYAVAPLDFDSIPVTVTVEITDPVTQSTMAVTYNNNIPNGGFPLDPDSSVTIFIGSFNMSVPGTYIFKTYTTVGGDGNAFNDTLISVINYEIGTASSDLSTVCGGNNVTLTLSGTSPGMAIQWQSSTDGGNTWINETGPGFDSTIYTVTPADTTLYRAEGCGSFYSNTDTIMYLPAVAPSTINDTICGPGTATVSASSAGTIYWYTNMTGGNPVSSGNTFTTNVNATTTWYAGTTTGSLNGSVGLYDNSGGGAYSASMNYSVFDVYQNCTLNGVYVYPAAVGTVIVHLQDSAGNIMLTDSLAITAPMVGQRTYVPLNFSLMPGVGYALIRDPASVNMWRNNAGVNYPYTLPGVLSITGSTAGAGFYYFYYDWQITYGCEGPRAAATIVVTPPPAMTLSANATTLCGGDTTSLNVSSSNATYSYTWSPAGTLSASTGSSVVATPTATTTYTLDANDPSGCHNVDSVTIITNVIPQVMIITDTVICSATIDTLVALYPSQSVGLFDNSAGGNMSASMNNLIFTVFQNSILSGVYVYPATAGQVIIDLEDATNAVINSATFTVTAADVNQKTFIPLNFNLAPATGMQLVRNAASVNLWRNNVGVNYPYTIPGVISITASTAGAGFYYFFYDWQVATTNYTFAWSSMPVGFTGTGDSVYVSPVVATQYFVTVTDTITGCVRSFQQSVDIAVPVGATITGDTTLCAGDSTWLYATTTGGDGNLAYSWSTSEVTGSIYIGPSSNTSYTLIVTDGCGFSAVAFAGVTVDSAAPVAAFTYAPTGLMTYTFTNGSANGAGYSWDFGDSGTSTSAAPVHTYASAGTYTVTLIVMNGCGADTTTQVISVDGIGGQNFDDMISVYPNPAHGQVTISAGEDAHVSLVTLLDVEGRTLQVIEPLANEPVITVDLHSLAAGVYVLKIAGEQGTKIVRLVVE
jgi:trimeric autotransporter adhesin